ncbi:MAG: COX15/CtaA family protein, partial [Chloroflexi bacterium]|nr:COX15/CtaA family protein [Chloroflexota bacterium]
MTALRRLALCTASATYLLIVVGAVVRTTGSGLGCGDDWPLCEGRLLPPPNPAAIVEWTHRLLGALVSPGILAVALLAWVRGRSRRAVLVPAILAPLLLAVQIGLGALVVRLDLAAMVVLVHLAFALLILGLLVWVAVAAVAG